jgi:hypothetical protein
MISDSKSKRVKIFGGWQLKGTGGQKVAWRIIEVDETEATDSDLTDSELVGISVALLAVAGRSANGNSVYQRVWAKLEPAVTRADSK